MQLHVVYKTLSSSIMMVYVETVLRRLKLPYSRLSKVTDYKPGKQKSILSP